MIKTGLNTFIGGMNKDLDNSILPKNKYRDATNYRVITTKGSTTGSLENIKGNIPISVDDLVDGFIVGGCQLRDDIILFVTENITATPEVEAGASRIYRCTPNIEDEEQTDLTLLYDDSLSSPQANLNFSTYYPIKCEPRYETPNIQKVYWTDGYNTLRYCNVAVNLTTDGLVKSGGNSYMSVDKFDTMPNFTPSKPVLSSIVGGKINTGLIAYTYQLYTVNGAETKFSPLSEPIHVVRDSDTGSTTLNYHGEDEIVNSGKGFTLTINNTNNIGFNRLRLVRVHYSYLNSTPEIFVVREMEISPSGEAAITVTDVGSVIRELTVDEFNLSNTEIFKCQDLSSKLNRLFVSNIEKVDFEVDEWDARAVRFDSTPKAEVWENGAGSADTINANLLNWDDVYPIDHDGINKFNDPDNDSTAAYAFKYQADGATLGAEGPNIKIDFETSNLLLDAATGNDKTYYTTSPDNWSTPGDNSYTNYASPWKGGKLSWQRDEVYRLYVVFGNDKGQLADPKWICDLRMPSLHDDTFHNSAAEDQYPSRLGYFTGLATETYRLYPRIYFKSFPANASFAQIYRVKRDRADKSVVTQGLLLPSRWDNAPGHDWYWQDPADHAITLAYSKMVSPEINISKNISKEANDYIEYVTDFEDGYSTATLTDSGNAYGNIFKCYDNTRVAYTANTRSTLDDAVKVIPALTGELDPIYSNGYPFKNYMVSAGHEKGKGCSGLLIAEANASWTAVGNKFVIANYKSNVFGSQYGGLTYEDRQRCISIPCSDIIYSTNTSTWIDVAYGDTYICYFDVSTILADLAVGWGDTWTETVYVPLESSINCDLLSSRSSKHLIINKNEPNDMLMQEYAGKHQESGDMFYIQEDDLYTYNSVYSQQLDVIFAIPLSVDKILETKFDSQIKVSNPKQNGEISDSWLKFGINNFIEVDSLYGPVNAIHTFNDKLYFFQDVAMGVLSIDDRSIITDNNSSKIVLGTGGILDRYDYLSTVCGCKDKLSVVEGITGMFWYDRVNNFIIRYSDQLDKISMSKGIQSYLNSNVLSTQSVISVSDVNNLEILWTFFEDENQAGSSAFTISFSENIDAFISFYTFIPNMYIGFNNRYFTTSLDKYTTNRTQRDILYLHDSLIYPRCYFYGLNSTTNACYADSTIKLLCNDDYLYTKTWDNISYMSNTYDDSDLELNAVTLDEVRFYNDYQNTDYVDLVYETNLRRRERSWTLDVPRNLVDATISGDPDIFLASNLTDTSRLFRERLRDKYMIADLVFHNQDGRGKFVLNNFGTRYRISYR